MNFPRGQNLNLNRYIENIEPLNGHRDGNRFLYLAPGNRARAFNQLPDAG